MKLTQNQIDWILIVGCLASLYLTRMAALGFFGE